MLKNGENKIIGLNLESIAYKIKTYFLVVKKTPEKGFCVYKISLGRLCKL